MKRALALASIVVALGAAWLALRDPPARRDASAVNTPRTTTEPVSASPAVLEAAPSAPRETVATPRDAPAGAVSAPDARTVDRTPRISGRVVDQDGTPVWNALVRAQPCGHVAPGADDGEAEFTARDGTFTIELHRDARHWLWIENLEYSAWRSWLTPVPDFAAGTRDIEIRLLRRSVAHIHVVDALDGASLPAVELRTISTPVALPADANPAKLVSGASTELESGNEPLEAQDATGIEFRLEEPPQTVFCWAPGYAAAIVTLTSESEQTLPLTRCGTIRGAITFAGQAREECSVRVRRQSTGSRLDEAQLASEVALDDTNRFALDGLAPGAYDVFAVLPERFGRAPLVLRTGVNVPAGAIIELGALDTGAPDPAREAASLRIVLELPPGLSPADVVNEVDVRVNGWRDFFDDNPSRPGAALRIARVPPGRAVCEFPMRTPSLAPRRSAAIDLGVSGEHELVLDLSDLPLCRLDVHAEASSAGAWFFVRYGRGESVALQTFTTDRVPFTLHRIVRGGERVVLERRNDAGEVTWCSVPLDVPHASERALEVHVP